MIKEQESELPTVEICRKHGLSTATFYKLKGKYGGMEVSDARRLRQLEDENGKLKRLLADSIRSSRICWEKSDDTRSAARRSAQGAGGLCHLPAPDRRPDRCRSQNGPAHGVIRTAMHEVAGQRRRLQPVNIPCWRCWVRICPAQSKPCRSRQPPCPRNPHHQLKQMKPQHRRCASRWRECSSNSPPFRTGASKAG